MATLNNVFNKNLYTTPYDYSKVQGVDGAKPRTYDGTVLLAAGLTQKNGNTFALIHAADVQLGQSGTERLTTKLESYDTILRELYGRNPSVLAALTSATNGHSTQSTPAANMDSISDLAYILNDRTETVDERIKDLRMFKTIQVTTGSSDAVNNLDAVNGSMVADNNEDTLTINSGNTWIKLAASGTSDVADDKLTIGHLVRSIDTSKTVTTDLNNSGTFVTYELTWDEAGHIRSQTKRTLTLSYNFKTIAISNATAVTDITTNTTSIVADTQVDTATLAAGNKWIRFAGNAENDTITIAHLIQNIQTTPNAGVDFNSATGTFIIYNFSQDEAGHITARSTTAYTLPYGFKTVTAGNSSAATAITGNTSSFSAANYVDSFAIEGGNKWINIAGANDKKITIGHALNGLGTKTNVGTSSIPTSQFGMTFNVPYMSTDQAGHITALDATTVTIPTCSLSDTGTGNVITGLTLSSSSGAFTVSRSNVGSLALTGISALATTGIEETDSINSAFAKIESAINTHTTASNPHNITAETIGLNKVVNTRQIDSIATAVANNIVTWGNNGHTVQDSGTTVNDIIEAAATAVSAALTPPAVSTSLFDGGIQGSVQNWDSAATYRYRWNSEGWSNLTSSTTPTYRPTATGTYTLTIEKTKYGLVTTGQDTRSYTAT